MDADSEAFDAAHTVVTGVAQTDHWSEFDTNILTYRGSAWARLLF
jgi:hypothetical protein